MRLGAVLDHLEAVRLGQRHDRIHVARHAARCTTMTALVFGVSTAEMVSAVMFCVLRSTSANTGRAPAVTAVDAEAMKVRGLTTTSSPARFPAP